MRSVCMHRSRHRHVAGRIPTQLLDLLSDLHPCMDIVRNNGGSNTNLNVAWKSVPCTWTHSKRGEGNYKIARIIPNEIKTPQNKHAFGIESRFMSLFKDACEAQRRYSSNRVVCYRGAQSSSASLFLNQRGMPKTADLPHTHRARKDHISYNAWFTRWSMKHHKVASHHVALRSVHRPQVKHILPTPSHAWATRTRNANARNRRYRKKATGPQKTTTAIR